MSLPSDVLLPVNSKYYGFTDSKIAYNTNWDVVWSFTFALTGNQHAFCTFLTTQPTISSGIPGQYLGYLGLSGSQDVNGVLAIAFDTTGFFALSNNSNLGVNNQNIKKDSLIIRDYNNSVIYNQSLSSLNTTFFLTSAIKSYQTLRFRFSNGGRMLYIDYKNDYTSYQNLLSFPINYSIVSDTVLYPGFTFCSPISSSSIIPSTLYLKNFHTQGSISDPTYEIIPCIPLSSSNPTIYTTISGIL